jgi:transketolase C-terminal domain/subunit
VLRRATDLPRRLRVRARQGPITVRDGNDVTIISNGTVLWRALAAAEQLAEEGVDARVISM